MEVKKNKNYLDPAEFYQETVACLRKDEISVKLCGMFQRLCEKYVNHPKFVRYHHIREDLISVGLMACVIGFPKFRPYRNDLVRDEEGNILTSTKKVWDGEHVEYDYRYCYNPFAFFTTCINNELLQFLKREYTYKNVMNKMRLENGLEADAGYTDMLREKDRQDRIDADGGYPDSDEDDSDGDLFEEFDNGVEWEND